MHTERPSYPNPVRAYSTTRARVAGVALLVAAAVVLVAALAKSWFTADYGDGGVGVLGLESCRGNLCRSMTWFDVRRIPIQIPIFATAALITCLALVGFAVHGGVVLLQARPDAVQLRWLSQLLGLASFAISAFVFSLSIGEWSRGLALGWSTFACAGSVIAIALITAFVVRPLSRRRATRNGRGAFVTAW